jgi:hypothetical protein
VSVLLNCYHSQLYLSKNKTRHLTNRNSHMWRDSPSKVPTHPTKNGTLPRDISIYIYQTGEGRCDADIQQPPYSLAILSFFKCPHRKNILTIIGRVTCLFPRASCSSLVLAHKMATPLPRSASPAHIIAKTGNILHHPTSASWRDPSYKREMTEGAQRRRHVLFFLNIFANIRVC